MIYGGWYKMPDPLKFVAGAAFIALLSVCVDDTGEPSASVPPPEEQACLRAVGFETGNSNHVLLSSSFAEAGTEVVVGVGPQRARWQRIAYRNGTTSRPMSLTDGGAA